MCTSSHQARRVRVRINGAKDNILVKAARYSVVHFIPHFDGVVRVLFYSILDYKFLGGSSKHWSGLTLLMIYRADIDGLRAIAVLGVIGFHAFPQWVQGGFVGVDVFFVISGFLISTLILERLEQNRFHLITFYSRRIRRIFPALLVMMVTCYVWGWFQLSPCEYKQLGEHIAAGATFLSNFVLWGEGGYFDAASETKPLLHLWSLAIEEQFYIVWPLILWVGKKKPFNLLLLIMLIGGISFAWNINVTDAHSPIKAFYMPHTRFWELCTGGILAYLYLHHHHLFLKKVLGFHVSSITSAIGSRLEHQRF